MHALLSMTCINALRWRGACIADLNASRASIASGTYGFEEANMARKGSTSSMRSEDYGFGDGTRPDRSSGTYGFVGGDDDSTIGSKIWLDNAVLGDKTEWYHGRATQAEAEGVYNRDFCWQISLELVRLSNLSPDNIKGKEEEWVGMGGRVWVGTCD